MARPIWTGTLSFGLLNVPVSVMPAERRVDLHFRMLDSRSNTPIRYERVNADTGEEVPWKDIVKAYEYKKGSYVVLRPEDLKSASPEGREAVEVEAFVDAASVGPEYFEKPYVLVLVLLRYPQELVDVEDYALPTGKTTSYRINAKELQMAEQLVDSMSGKWEPGDFRDEFRDRLHKVIEKRMKSKGVVTPIEDEAETPENATTNVVDFMSLLQKSLASKKRTPAKKVAAGAKTKGGAAPRKRATAKATKKAPARKRASRRSA
jgi:DNA end-binding protein Ku